VDIQSIAAVKQRLMRSHHEVRRRQNASSRGLITLAKELLGIHADPLRQHSLATREVDDRSSVTVARNDRVKQEMRKPREKCDG
jgi:hypothetical protein